MSNFQNRNINFRGIAKSTGSWVYGYYLEKPLYSAESNVKEPVDVISEILEPDTAEHKGKLYTVLSVTVGQYTGLHDVKGNKVYESDILISTNNRKYYVIRRPGGPCLFNQKEYDDLLAHAPVILADALADAQTSAFVMQNLTVIGNIFELGHDKTRTLEEPEYAGR